MSRTYRRRRYRQMFGYDDPLRDFWCREEEIIWSDIDYVALIYDYGPTYTRYSVKYNKNSKTGRKLVKVAMSDAKTHNFKEPGPSWFRNLYSQRPYRRSSKRELQKYINNPDYEPMILSKEPLPYWT